jgi:hypothetical protein
MTTSRKPSQTYLLKLVKELLALETSISHGTCRFSSEELAGRLLLVDRLLTAPLEDLATLGMPVPLPTAAAIIRTTLTALQARALRRHPTTTEG